MSSNSRVDPFQPALRRVRAQHLHVRGVEHDARLGVRVERQHRALVREPHAPVDERRRDPIRPVWEPRVSNLSHNTSAGCPQAAQNAFGAALGCTWHGEVCCWRSRACDQSVSSCGPLLPHRSGPFRGLYREQPVIAAGVRRVALIDRVELVQKHAGVAQLERACRTRRESKRVVRGCASLGALPRVVVMVARAVAWALHARSRKRERELAEDTRVSCGGACLRRWRRRSPARTAH